MPDSGRPDHDLERELRDLGAHVEYPPTPDLGTSVRRRLDEEGSRSGRRGPWPSFLSPGWAVGAAAVALVVVLALSPTVRTTLSGVFSAQGAGSVAENGGAGSSGSEDQDRGVAPEGREGTTSAEQAAGPESPGEATTSADLPTSGTQAASGGQSSDDLAASGGGGTAGGAPALGKGMGFGKRIPLSEARARAGERVLLPGPPSLGEPDEVYASTSPRRGTRTFVYQDRPGLPPLGETGIGLILTRSPGDVGASYPMGRGTYVTRIEEVRVDGRPGYWVPRGRGAVSPFDGARRLPGNVLIWERANRTFRMQTNLGEREALRLAASVR